MENVNLLCRNVRYLLSLRKSCLLLIFIFGISLGIIGCGTTAPSPSYVPAWDSDVPLNSGDTETPSLSERLGNIFSEGKGDYNFRKVRWGWSQKRVEFAEAKEGNTVFERRDNAIVYKCKLNGVYCKLIYTFKNNNLRTAGYISMTPVPNAENLIKAAVDKYGLPDKHGPAGCGLEEMVWKSYDTVIFANLSATVTKFTRTKFEYSGSGLFGEFLRKQLPKQRPGVTMYYDVVYAHVDPAFFNDVIEGKFPLLLQELSFYEKQLTGVLLKSQRIMF